MIDKNYLINRRFGRLIVVEWKERREGQSIWLCRCDCGKTTSVYYCSLISGNTASCGCARGEAHGMSRSREYKSWAHAKSRCLNPRDKKFRIYGARGINFCKEWAVSFSAFFSYMGECPDGKTLDRIDTNRGYEPGNCRWATASEQANNTRLNKIVTLDDGRKFTITEVAKEFGYTRDKIRGVYERHGIKGVKRLCELSEYVTYSVQL